MQRGVDKITADKNEGITCLTHHSEKLLTQIKKLKNDKQSLKNKLELVMKDKSKSSNVTVQIENKGMNIDPINIITQKEDKPAGGKTYLDVAIQMMKNPNEDFVTNSTTLVFEVN